MDAIGQYPLSMKQVGEGKIKITPDILIQSSGDGKDGGNANNVLAAFIASLMGGNGKLIPAVKDSDSSDKSN